MPADLDRHLDRWLIALHGVEQQARVQLRVARRIVSSAELRQALGEHLEETDRHRLAIRARLAARRRRSSPVHDLGATLNRTGFLLYTGAVRDAPGKLLADSVAYEYLEVAAYRMLVHGAERAGDAPTAAVAREILAEEEAMGGRLAGWFEWAVQESRRRARSEPRAALIEHLRESHALESQAAVLLTLGIRVAGSPELAAHYRTHLSRTREQRQRLAERLRVLGSRPSALKSPLMAAAGGGWAVAWALQRETPAKLACFLFAALHLEVAAYELLRREAAQAGDLDTERLAGTLLAEEQAAAAALGEHLLEAADAALAG